MIHDSLTLHVKKNPQAARLILVAVDYIYLYMCLIGPGKQELSEFNLLDISVIVLNVYLFSLMQVNCGLPDNVKEDSRLMHERGRFLMEPAVAQPPKFSQPYESRSSEPKCKILNSLKPTEAGDRHCILVAASHKLRKLSTAGYKFFVSSRFKIELSSENILKLEEEFNSIVKESAKEEKMRSDLFVKFLEFEFQAYSASISLADTSLEGLVTEYVDENKFITLDPFHAIFVLYHLRFDEAGNMSEDSKNTLTKLMDDYAFNGNDSSQKPFKVYDFLSTIDEGFVQSLSSGVKNALLYFLKMQKIRFDSLCLPAKLLANKRMTAQFVKVMELLTEKSSSRAYTLQHGSSISRKFCNSY